MKKQSDILSALCFLALLLSAAALSTQAQTAGENAPAPRAVVPQRLYDFGDVPKGEPLLYLFPVRNEGTADLELEALPGG